MSDYTEHLISMAGGDVEPDLDAIQARADAALFHAPYKVVDDTYGKKVVQTSNHPDLRPYVLASKMAPVIADFVAEAPKDIAALLAVVRSQQAKIERVWSIHKPIKVYDECECPDGTHPDEYEWIDCEDYNGCEYSFRHWACEECCTDGDYITETCTENHRHGKFDAQRCPTIAALTATEGAA